MKSKTYILKQIRDLLIDNKAYSERRADEFIENAQGKTVYELLVIKKDLSEQPKEHFTIITKRIKRIPLKRSKYVQELVLEQ